jgi:hypothetical protein
MRFLRFRKTGEWIRDIRNFLYLRSVVRKNVGTADWTRLDLRADWVYRIYTVVNPDPGDKGDDENMLKIKMGEKMIPYHRYIEDIGLGEVVAVSAEKIPDSESYLLVYYPLFRRITTWRVVRNLFFLILLILFRNQIANIFTWAAAYWPW